MPHNILEVISVLQMDDFTVAGVRLLEGPEPDLDMFYLKESTGEQWRVGGFGHIPIHKYEEGIRAITFQPVLHNGTLAKNDKLVLIVENADQPKEPQRFRYHFTFPGLTATGALNYFSDAATARNWVLAKLQAVFNTIGDHFFIDSVTFVPSTKKETKLDNDSLENNDALAEKVLYTASRSEDLQEAVFLISENMVSKNIASLHFNFRMNLSKEPAIRKLPEYECRIYSNSPALQNLREQLTDLLTSRVVS